MKDRWKNKNINLNTLSERMVEFFISKGFDASLQKKNDKFMIFAAPKRFHGISEKVVVSVAGKPEDFSIEFRGGSYSRSLVLYGSLLSFISGGFFVLKGLKSLEEIEKLEKSFWIYVDQVIWHLSNPK